MSEHYDSEPWESLRIGDHGEPRAPHVGEVWRYAPDGSSVRVTVLRPEWVDYVRVPSGEPGYFGRRAWQKFWSFDPDATGREAARAFLAGTAARAEAQAEERSRGEGAAHAAAAIAWQAVAVIARSAQVEALAEMARDIAGLDYEEPPHADSRCARCGGPVLLTSCAREGGCRTAAERVDARCPHPLIAAEANGYEYDFWVDDMGIKSDRFPTSEMALAQWRERALAVERGR